MVKSLFDLTGKVALVTGAGQGLGRGYAYALAGAGASVVCLDKDLAAARQTMEMLYQDNALAVAVQCDITLKNIADLFDRLDILVNNAGVEIAEEILEVTPEHYDRIMAVNMIPPTANGLKNGSLRAGGTAEDLAGTVVFLASSASDYVTGQSIVVDQHHNLLKVVISLNNIGLTWCYFNFPFDSAVKNKTSGSAMLSEKQICDQG